MALTEIRDIMAMGLLAAGGYLAYDFWKKSTVEQTDSGGMSVPAPGIGTGTGTVYIPSPDVAYPNHPFHELPVFGGILDPVYDAGWNFAGWQRATFGEWTGW